MEPRSARRHAEARCALRGDRSLRVLRDLRRCAAGTTGAGSRAADVQFLHAADRADRHRQGQGRQADRGPDREGLRRHRGRRAADDQLCRVPASRRFGSRRASHLRPCRRGPRRRRRPPPAEPQIAAPAAPGEHQVPGPPPRGLVFRPYGDAAARSASARTRPRSRYIDDQMQPHGPARDHDVPGRRRAREAGLHRQPRAAASRSSDVLIYGEDKDGDGVPDPPEDTATAFGQDDAEFNIFNTDRQLAALQTAVAHAAPAARAEVARLLRQRPAAERRRQSGAAARDDQRRAPRERVVVSGRRARPGGGGPARRRDAALARRRRHVLRPAGPGGGDQFPAVAGHLVRAWRRTPAARRCSTTTICRSASCRPPTRRRATTSSATTARTPRPTAGSAASRCRSHGACPPICRIARATSATRNSPSSPRPTRSASSKTR